VAGGTLRPAAGAQVVDRIEWARGAWPVASPATRQPIAAASSGVSIGLDAWSITVPRYVYYVY
jgi:hypothetical protein